MPCFSARWPASWIAGPSAIGSENGMPISLRSAPAAGRPANSRPQGRGSKPDAETVGDGVNVLVAAAAHVHHDQVVARQGRRDLSDMSQRMSGFERRDDALEPARQLKRLERLIIGDRDVLDAPDVVQ